MAGEPRRSSFWLLPLTGLLLIGGGYGARVLLIRLAEKSIAEHQREILTETACVVYQAPGPMTAHPRGGDNLWDLLHPALDALETLKTDYDDFDPEHGEFANLRNLTGITIVLEDARPNLDACRAAMARSNRQWRGERDPYLPSKSDLAGRLLCMKAYLEWKQGLDAEAIDGVLLALEVARITCQLELDRTRAQKLFLEIGAYDLLLRIESWACEASRHILSNHRLSAAQLAEFERRLDVLRGTRPWPISALANWSAYTRRDVLAPDFSVQIRDAAGVASRGYLRENLGLRDLYDERFRISRMLGRIRRSALNAQTLHWNDSRMIEPLWEARCLGFTDDDVDQLWSLSPGFETVYRALLLWDLLRVSVGVARYEAANNQLPLILDNAGVGEILARPVTLHDNTVMVSLYPPGMKAVPDPVDPSDWTWTIHRH